MGSITTTYPVDDAGTIQALKEGNETLIFMYDSTGTREGFLWYTGSTKNGAYYYLYNGQGDVIGIVASDYTPVVYYDYNAWGEPYETTGTQAETIGKLNPFRYRGYCYDEETGFYYLNSRYYDSEIGRFLNVDKVVSGIGGEILGYNLYAYCFNNPVNMYDLTGQRPVVVQGVGAQSKYVFAEVKKTIDYGFYMQDSFVQASFGMGIGLGASGSVNVKRVEVGAGAVSSITNSVSYDKGVFDIKNTTATSIGVSVANIVEGGYSNGREHSFFDEKCTCRILHDSFVKQSNCPANTSFQRTSSMIGVSFNFYLLLGVEFSIGVDVDALRNKVIDIFDEPYTIYY